jgi:hypothetical protein
MTEITTLQGGRWDYEIERLGQVPLGYMLPNEELIRRKIKLPVIPGVRFSCNIEIEDLAEVPREYWEPVDKVIREAIREGVRVIPGIRIFEVFTPGEFFSVGDRVSHHKFGDGTVTAIENNMLAIHFDHAGRKRVMASYVQMPK